MGRVPLQVLKEPEHQARQNLSTINFTAIITRTASSCNTVMEKCQHSIKGTFKRVKSQIQKGDACDYFEIMNKKILIQQRALACLSKSVSHILQRELYTMGNTGLLRREAEITLLQPHLGDSRRQELRNSPFWPIPLFKSLKDGEDFLLKKGTPKDPFGVQNPESLYLDPTKTSPFVVPTTTRKEAPTGNAPMRAIPLKAVTSRFPQVGGNQTQETSGVVFDPTQGDESVETSPPNDSFQASLSPPVGGRPLFFQKRLAQKQMFKRVKHYHQSLGFYSCLFLVPKPHQRWRPVIDLSRLNKFLLVERFKMETPESIRASLIPREWVSSIDPSDAYLHIPIHPNSRKYRRFCHRSQVFQFTSLPFGLATATQVFTMIVKR